ncbi:hypothetical protein ACFWPX_31720 [Nocardia sp. NPDC058518]|uniref:hypothetical protein n=1 Tax=Nocardia sp. NPDC058518 TaxID=3346534 RepID=UPI003658060A
MRGRRARLRRRVLVVPEARRGPARAQPGGLAINPWRPGSVCPAGPSVDFELRASSFEALPRGNGVHKRDHCYGAVLDRGNLANVGLNRLLSGFTRILTEAATYLRPGGHIVITARPWRQHAELINLPAYIITCGTLAGLIPVERCVALLGRLADGDLIARSSFFQRDFISKQRNAGLPFHLIPTKT